MVSFGKPFQEIARAAKSNGVDLTIIATHGYTRLKRIQLGSSRGNGCSLCPVSGARASEPRPAVPSAKASSYSMD